MIIATGSTDVTTYFVLRDSTNHAPKTDVTVTDIDLYYLEQGAAMAAKVDATALAAADSAHSDNTGYHVGQGLYRIDWPDAAFDGGAGKKAYLIVVCSGVDTTFLEVELSPPVGAAASVTGAVGSVTGAVGSITGVTFPTNFEDLAITNTTGYVSANTVQWNGSAVATPTVAGVPEVDVTYVGGSAASGVATIDANVIEWKGDTAPAMTGDAYAAVTAIGSSAADIADAVLARGIQNAEGTIATNGAADAKDFLCLGSLILATFESGISETTWTINETDGSTALFTRTLTVDETGTAKPITDVT